MRLACTIPFPSLSWQPLVYVTARWCARSGGVREGETTFQVCYGWEDMLIFPYCFTMATCCCCCVSKNKKGKEKKMYLLRTILESRLRTTNRTPKTVCEWWGAASLKSLRFRVCVVCTSLRGLRLSFLLLFTCLPPLCPSRTALSHLRRPVALARRLLAGSEEKEVAVGK